MATYQYVDTSGKMQTVNADTSALALKGASNIDPHSGVSLVSSAVPSSIPVDTLSTPQKLPDLPTAPTYTADHTGTMGDGGSTIDAFQNLLAKYEGLKPPSLQDTYNTDYKASNIDALTADFNAKNQTLLDSTNKLNATKARLDALKTESDAIPVRLQQQSEGRGITEAGLAPIQADQLRAVALRALPIQAEAMVNQAEVAAAQGNAQLSQSILQSAQNHLDTIFQIHAEDAKADYAFRTSILDKLWEVADKADQRRLEARKEELSTNQSNLADARNFAQQLSLEAMKNGQSGVAAKIASLTPPDINSKTFADDLANYNAKIATYQSQFAPKSSSGTDPNKLLTIEEAKALGVPYGTTVGQAIQKGIVPGQTGSGSSSLQLANTKSQVDLIGNLLGDKYLTSAVGTNALGRVSFSNIFTGGKTNFIAGVEELRSQLNLDKLIQSKAQGATFGALSDNELKTLASAATKLGTFAIKDSNGNITGYNANEKDFKTELDKINNFAKLDYIIRGGDPADVSAKIMADGTIWALNSDGTYTKIK